MDSCKRLRMKEMKLQITKKEMKLISDAIK